MKAFSFLAFFSFLFFSACSFLKEKVDYEKYSRGTKIEVKEVSLSNPYFTYAIQLEKNGETSTKDLSINADKIITKVFTGKIKEIFKDLKIQIGAEASNEYPFSFQINSIRTDIYVPNRSEKLTTMTFSKIIVLEKSSSKMLYFDFSLPENLKISELLTSNEIQVKGVANVSLIYKDEPLPGIDVSFDKTVAVPTASLKERMSALDIDLSDI